MARVKAWRVAVLTLLTVGSATIVLRGIQQLGFWSSNEWRERRPFHSTVDRTVRVLESDLHNLETVRDMRSGALGRRAQLGQLTLIASDVRAESGLSRAAQIAEHELQRMPGRREGFPAMVLLQYSNRSGYFFHHQTVLPADDVCALTTPTRSLELATMEPVDHFPVALGTCALYLAYGAPGHAARQWMATFGDRTPFLFDTRPDERDERGRLVINLDERRFFDARDYVVLLRFTGCAEGSGDHCLALLNEPWNNTMRADFVWWMIKRDAGRSFLAFWQAGGSFEEAIQVAFGQDVNGLLGEFGADYLVIKGSRPTLPLSAVLNVLFFVVLALAIATAVSRRRLVAAS